MKTFVVACMFSIFAIVLDESLANAGEIYVLPEPSIKTISNTACAPYVTPNDSTTPWTRQAVTGISADGTTVTAVAEGRYPCTNAKSYCVQFTWTLTRDLSGVLQPPSVATFKPLASCPTWAQISGWQAQQYFDTSGYEAYTSVQNNCSVYGCYAHNIASLATP